MTFSAPTARNVIAWANGPGGKGKRFAALKARNVMGRFPSIVISRLQRYQKLNDFPWGVAPGCRISRLWR